MCAATAACRHCMYRGAWRSAAVVAMSGQEVEGGRNSQPSKLEARPDRRSQLLVGGRGGGEGEDGGVAGRLLAG